MSDLFCSHLLYCAEFIYQEAFLTTYRTFISPRALIEKLLYRFHKFHHAADGRKKLARNSFSLLIRVIDELGYVVIPDIHNYSSVIFGT